MESDKINALVTGVLSFLSTKPTAKMRYTAPPQLEEEVRRLYTEGETLMKDTYVDCAVESGLLQKRLVWRSGENGGIFLPDKGGASAHCYWKDMPLGILVDTITLLPKLLDALSSHRVLVGANILKAASEAVQRGVSLPLIKPQSPIVQSFENDVPVNRRVLGRDVTLTEMEESTDSDYVVSEIDDQDVPVFHPVKKEDKPVIEIPSDIDIAKQVDDDMMEILGLPDEATSVTLDPVVEEIPNETEADKLADSLSDVITPPSVPTTTPMIGVKKSKPRKSKKTKEES